MRHLLGFGLIALFVITGCGDDSTTGGGGSGAGASSTPSGSGPGAGPSSGSGLPSVGGIFTKPEPWTKDVSGLSPDGTSDAIIGALDSMGGWGNGNVLQIDFSIPLMSADASTPRRTITESPDGYCYGGIDCTPVPLQMPIPTNGNTEGSDDYGCDTSENDCHVLVVATDEKKLYELYNASGSGSDFTALGAFV